MLETVENLKGQISIKENNCGYWVIDCFGFAFDTSVFVSHN